MSKKRFIIFTSVFSVITILLSGISGVLGIIIGNRLLDGGLESTVGEVLQQDIKVVNEESAIINAVEKASPSVVSIIITKDVPVYENYYMNPYEDDFGGFFNFRMPRRQQIGTEEQQIGAGSGFVISEDGMIVTNRHVVSDEDASYTVIFNNDEKSEAKVVARDTLLDIAFLKVDADNLTPLPLGSSKNLKVGQSVIAIGNALGQFSNSVSSGIISGLQRNIVAGDQTGTFVEQISNVIQTDASINQGNSGGPLLDVEGNVIGVNVATATQAENIGFAIPIDLVKDLLERLQEDGSIERPVLGVRYQLVTEEMAEENDMEVTSGALVVRGERANDLAVIPGSPADKAGIIENDIILEVDGVEVNQQSPLNVLIQEKKVGEEVTLTVWRKGELIEVKVKLT